MRQDPSGRHNLFSFATSWNPSSYAGVLWAKLVQSYMLFQELYREGKKEDSQNALQELTHMTVVLLGGHLAVISFSIMERKGEGVM